MISIRGLIRMDKRGEEFVEAAVVLPLLILVILSMIMVAVFLFSHQVSETEAQTLVMKESRASGQVFGVKRRGVSSSKYIMGLAAGNTSKTDTVRAYVISQADAVMIGELAG